MKRNTSASIPIEVLHVFPDLGKNGLAEKFIRNSCLSHPRFCGICVRMSFQIGEEAREMAEQMGGVKAAILGGAWMADGQGINAAVSLFSSMWSPVTRMIAMSDIPAVTQEARKPFRR